MLAGSDPPDRPLSGKPTNQIGNPANGPQHNKNNNLTRNWHCSAKNAEPAAPAQIRPTVHNDAQFPSAPKPRSPRPRVAVSPRPPATNRPPRASNQSGILKLRMVSRMPQKPRSFFL